MPPDQTFSADAMPLRAFAPRLPPQPRRGPMSVLTDVMSGTALLLMTLVVSVAVGAVVVRIATVLGRWTTMLIAPL